MRKIWIIAVRDYRAAVRSKSFIVTLVLMPVLMAGSIGIQMLFKKLDDTKAKRFAVIDRTGGKLAADLEKAVQIHNDRDVIDLVTGQQIAPRFELELVPPSANDPEAIDRQRFELSNRVERGDLDGTLEIGPKVLDLRPGPPLGMEQADDQYGIRFQAKKPTLIDFQRWAETEVNRAIRQMHFAEIKLTPQQIALIQQHVPGKFRALTRQNAEGKFEEAGRAAQTANFLLPAVLIGLMFMVIMVGATPAMQGVVEEKGQRIAEVLLGSVSPTQLMAGKVLGVIGVSMTMAVVYFVGGFIVADRYGLAGAVTPELIVWFVIFLTLELLMFGSLFIAVGAAAADVKDTQTLLMPIMLIACLPLFAMGPIMQDPNGKIAVVCSFIPFATPMLLVARQSVPPGVPVWQMVVGIVLVLLTTVACVWAAGRIFRVGILMQGKGAKMGDLLRWVIRG